MRSVTTGVWPTQSKLIALRYEVRRELTFFEGTLVIQICYRIVVLSLWNTSARKKKSPDPLPPNSRISNPFVFPCSNSIDSLSREQKSHFWICENYRATGGRFFVLNLSTKLFPTTKKNLWVSAAPQPTQHTIRSEIPEISPRMLVSQRYGAHLSQGGSTLMICMRVHVLRIRRGQGGMRMREMKKAEGWREPGRDLKTKKYIKHNNYIKPFKNRYFR